MLRTHATSTASTAADLSLSAPLSPPNYHDAESFHAVEDADTFPEPQRNQGSTTTTTWTKKSNKKFAEVALSFLFPLLNKVDPTFPIQTLETKTTDLAP
jgi:hypothetical protein